MANQEVLFEKVYVPEFVKQCSAAGIQFADEDELASGIRTALKLRAVDQPEPQGSGVKEAEARLDAFLTGSAAQPEQATDVGSYLEDDEVLAAARA